MDNDNDFELERVDNEELSHGHSYEDEDTHSEPHDEQAHRSNSSVSSLVEKVQEKIHRNSEDDFYDVSFGASIYTDAEINKMKHDVDMAESEVIARRSDVSNWESKVSLNNTEEHKKNGDYSNAVSHLNDAKSRYNAAVDRLNAAKSKLNNAL